MTDQAEFDILVQGIEQWGIEPTKLRIASTRSNPRTISLSEVDGVLRWDIGQKRKVVRGEVKRLRSFRFEELPPNQLSSRLQKLDTWLTPNQGLRAIDRDGIHRESTPIPKGKILLFIHGTFSNNENVVGALLNSEHGRMFMDWALKKYDQLLAFDHPTLSVSPFLNAVALSRHFHASTASVDIICHSRGGLVARWWLEVLPDPDSEKRKVIFVGAPLGGTGLASPWNIRQSLDLLATYSSRLATVSGIGGFAFPIAAPMFQASAVIAGIVSTVSKAGASTPAIDTAVNLVPGLAAQSRQGVNDEILCLRRGFSSERKRELLNVQTQNYYFVTSNFETKDSRWAFWRAFRKDRILNNLSDFVFEGANDLVVDTPSMTDLADEFGTLDLDRQVMDFGSTDQVHHCNYFQFPDTTSFMRKCLT